MDASGIASSETSSNRETPLAQQMYSNNSMQSIYCSRRIAVAFLMSFGFFVTLCMQTYFYVLTIMTGENRSAPLIFNLCYVITQVPGGYIALKYPGHRIFGGAVLVSSIMTALMPIFIGQRINNGVLIVNIIKGLVEGVMFPACISVLHHWAPSMERARLATFAFCGIIAGDIFGKYVCNANNPYNQNVPFYIFAIFGITWFILWVLLVSERPNNERSIDKHDTIPWISIITSLPVWAIFSANFCRTFKAMSSNIFLASFLFRNYDIRLQKDIMFGIVPRIVALITMPLAGILADYLQDRKSKTTTYVRKIFDCGGFAIQAILLASLVYFNSYLHAMAVVNLDQCMSSLVVSCYIINHLDITPNYACLLIGLSNVIGYIAAIVYDELLAMILANLDGSIADKCIIILVSFTCLIGAILYGLFASGEVQKWDMKQAEEVAMVQTSDPASKHSKA